jgi:hypothetical protein
MRAAGGAVAGSGGGCRDLRALTAGERAAKNKAQIYSFL